MSSTPIIRVARKRCADSQPSLLVQFKRAKADPLLFSLYKTSDGPEILDDTTGAVNIVDFRRGIVQPPVQVDQVDETSPLSFANESVGEIGGPEPRPPRVDGDVITVNGRPLVPVNDEIVFDFYKISRGVLNSDDVAFDEADCDMRFATKEDELMFYPNSESESETNCRDDEDDSNDEGNWRNDYPDEDEDSENEGERLDFDSYEECDSDDDSGGLRLRMQRFGLDAPPSDQSDDDYD